MVFKLKTSGAFPHDLPLRARHPVDGLSDVETLGEALPEDVVDAVADLKPSILDGRTRPMGGAGQAPHERVPAGLQDPKALLHDLGHPADPSGTATLIGIPLAAHERDSSRRVGHDRIDRGVGKGTEDFEAISENDRVERERHRGSSTPESLRPPR